MAIACKAMRRRIVDMELMPAFMGIAYHNIIYYVLTMLGSSMVFIVYYLMDMANILGQ